jgi:HK97 family phage portal protein
MGWIDALLRPFRNNTPQASVTPESGESHWWRPGSAWGAQRTLAGESVTEDSLLTSATCHACTRALSETVAGLPGFIYKDSIKKRDLYAQSHAQELLTEQPNPEMDAFTFWELLVARVTNSGNFFAEIQRNTRDEPEALWPIHPSRVRPMRDTTDGSLFWEISADYTGTPAYSDPTWRQEHLRYLGPHNMLNIVGFGSRNGIIGPGALPFSEEVGVEFAIRRYGADFFRSDATPSGMVTHPKFIDNPAKRQEFRNDINQIHTNQRHKTGVMWDGATYERIGVDPQQAQALESRKFSSDQLCKFYGVAPPIVGDYRDSKFATADAVIRAFVMITLRNLVIRCEKAINRQVLNVRNESGKMERAFSKNLIYQIAIDGLLRGDPKAQAETHRMYRETGILSTNEIRDEIGQNPVEGPEGDYRIVAGGMARLDKIDEQGSRGKNAPEQQSASLPSFDRERLAADIANSGVIETPTTVRGHDPKADDPIDTYETGMAAINDAKVVNAAVKVAESAVARIDTITATQIERWREQDPSVVAAKMPEFFVKQGARLLDALSPLADLGMPAAAETISTAYVSGYSSLDNYQIFDAALRPKVDIHAHIS